MSSLRGNQNMEYEEDESCWKTYCPCFPECKCDKERKCSLNCSKKRMIIPVFILSAISLVLIIIALMTKVSDTDTYIEFKENDDKDLEYEKYKNDFDDILDIESLEDKLTLGIITATLFIFFVSLICLICFINEKKCFYKYKEKCRRPYYSLMIIVNIIASFVNVLLCILLFSYRRNSIDKFKNYPFFDNKFRKNNDFNISVDVISAFCYFLCLILNLITCYHLYKENEICKTCCSEIEKYVKKCCCVNDNKKKAILKRDMTLNPFPKKETQNLNRSQNPSRNINPRISIPASSAEIFPINENTDNNKDKYIIKKRINSVNIQNKQNELDTIMDNNENEEIKKKIESVCKTVIFTACLLCKKEIKEKRTIKVLPCGHSLHEDCTVPYFLLHKECIICKKSVIN